MLCFHYIFELHLNIFANWPLYRANVSVTYDNCALCSVGVFQVITLCHAINWSKTKELVLGSDLAKNFCRELCVDGNIVERVSVF